MDILKPIKNRREVNFNQTIQVLLLTSIILAISAVIGASQLSNIIPSNLAGYGLSAIGIGVFIVVFIGGLLYGWLIQLTMNVLVGKGKYLDGLATISYSLLPISFGVLISAIVSYIPIIGGLISFIVMAIFGVIGYALMFKLTKTLFATDMITAFIGVTVIWGITGLSVYAGVASSLLGVKGLFPNLSSTYPLLK